MNMCDEPNGIWFSNLNEGDLVNLDNAWFRCED
jgi:hypothetical protein